MSKNTARQIIVNWLIILISGGVIGISKVLALQRFIGWNDFLGSDVVFTMISAMIGTRGWRYVEDIKSDKLNVVCYIYIGVLAILYGACIGNPASAFHAKLVAFAFVVFMIIYVIEHACIVKTLIKRNKKSSKNSLAQRD